MILETYLRGELPPTSAIQFDEQTTLLNTVQVGHRALNLIAESGALVKTPVDYFGNSFGLAQPIELTIPSFDSPVLARISVTASHRFRNELDYTGRLTTSRTHIPQRNLAIIAVGASVLYGGEQTIYSLSSTVHSGYETIPGLDNLRHDTRNQIPVEFHRIAFIKSVVDAIKNPQYRQPN